MPISRCARALVVLCVLVPGAAGAHGLGASQLRLRVDGVRVEGAWEAQLADARRASGLDPAPGGEAGWRELDAREAVLRDRVVRGLTISADGAACAVRADAPVEWQRELEQVRVPLRAACPIEPRRLSLGWDLLFDREPTHRAYYAVEDARTTQAGVFRAERRRVELEVRQQHPGADFLEFAREGLRHIWGGIDHLLFLFALLLPAPLVRAEGAWSRREGLGASGREVLKVVTAFTVAHSLTLALATVGGVAPPARLVEVAIALSVLAAAWNNLRPFLPGRAWVMAFAFGLVHGLGFAGALRNLALPLRARGLALLAFNVGVEAGQLAIVVPLLPLLYAASRRRGYARLGMGVGSLAIAWVAALWVLERGLGVALFTRS
jgi:hypothetical protein